MGMQAVVALLVCSYCRASRDVLHKGSWMQRGYGDGVMLLSVQHKNQPLTIFDTEIRKNALPAMMSRLSLSMLQNQVFDLKYENYQKRMWLELKKEPLVKVGGTGMSLQGLKTQTPPFMYLRRIPKSTRFQLVHEGRCLTVDDEITYKNTRGRILSFRPCEDRSERQMFVMIPSFRAVAHLNPEARTREMSRRIETVSERIRRVMDAIDLGQFD